MIDDDDDDDDDEDPDVDDNGEGVAEEDYDDDDAIGQAVDDFDDGMVGRDESREDRSEDDWMGGESPEESDDVDSARFRSWKLERGEDPDREGTIILSASRFYSGLALELILISLLLNSSNQFHPTSSRPANAPVLGRRLPPCPLARFPMPTRTTRLRLHPRRNAESSGSNLRRITCRRPFDRGSSCFRA